MKVQCVWEHNGDDSIPCGSFLVWTHFYSGKTAEHLSAMNLQVIFDF